MPVTTWMVAESGRCRHPGSDPLLPYRCLTAKTPRPRRQRYRSGVGRELFGPGVVDFEDFERFFSGGELSGHGVADAFADERAGQRRENRDAAARRLGFVGADDPVADFFAGVVLEADGGAEGHADTARRGLDDLGAA